MVFMDGLNGTKARGGSTARPEVLAEDQTRARVNTLHAVLLPQCAIGLLVRRKVRLE